MQRLVVSGLVLASVALVAASHADGPRVEYPTGDVVWHTTDKAHRMQIECSPVSPAPNGRPRIECLLVQVMLRLPKTAEEAAKENAETSRAIRAEVAKDAPKFWSKCNVTVPPEKLRELEAEEAALVRGFNAACAKRDVDDLIHVATGSSRATKTCSLTVWTTRETLTYMDANTWGATVGPRGACNTSFVLSLWRDKSALWNYKQVRTVPETERGFLCDKIDRVSVSEWRWNARKNERLGCEYVD